MLSSDAALSALYLAVGYLVARGFDGRSTLHHTGAGVLVGFAMTVKLTAVAVLVPLVVAVVWRPPASGIDVGGYRPFVVEGLDRRWGPGEIYRVARIVESPSLVSP